jgi:hypothetical protein
MYNKWQPIISQPTKQPTNQPTHQTTKTTKIISHIDGSVVLFALFCSGACGFEPSPLRIA